MQELGRLLLKRWYEDIVDSDGNLVYVVRPTNEEEKEKGSDFFVVSNKLESKYLKIKTDKEIKETNLLSLELYKEGDKLEIGEAMQTFPDYFFYWVYPTAELLYWNPTELNPYLIKQIQEIKNFFSRTIKLEKSELLETGLIRSHMVSHNLLDDILDKVN
ncbi:MAG: hypothetical protein CL508_05205 [Actinobacteria bacterium]|nr:hypothetical protein [Actinomycetota bacterium]|tara:strand:- start:20572 stop:21051 length:480 start_codon:yes stop_codon:yes gene_type:complete